MHLVLPEFRFNVSHLRACAGHERKKPARLGLAAKTLKKLWFFSRYGRFGEALLHSTPLGSLDKLLASIISTKARLSGIESSIE